MALSGSELTRIDVIGFPGRAYTGFTAKNASSLIIVPGLEYTLKDDRLHYTPEDDRLHYTLPNDLLHYTMRE